LLDALHSTPGSRNVTAGGRQVVMSAKYENHRLFNLRPAWQVGHY